MGYVADIFTQERLARLPGDIAIGHVRYSTAGGSMLCNAQPIVASIHAAALSVLMSAALGAAGDLCQGYSGLPDGEGPQAGMVWIEGGSFTMGSHAGEDGHQPSEGPMRVVSISSFAIGRYEVTFGQWDACVAEDACSQVPNDRGWGRSTRPVIYVSWQDIQDFLAWISRKAGVTPGSRFVGSA